MGLAFAVWVAVFSQGQTFADDFESNTLLKNQTPAGKWDGIGIVGTTTLGPSDGGAHRGNFGLSFVDTASGIGQQADSQIVSDVNLTGALHLRTWLRVQPTSGNGWFFPILLGCPACTGAAVELAYDHALDEFDLRMWTTTTVTDKTFAGASYKNRWVLAEIWVYDLGGANSGGRLYFDGVEVARTDNINQTGIAVAQVHLGSAWQISPITGRMDFDDVRWGPTPGPSRLRISGSAVVERGMCVSLTLTSVTSIDGGVVGPPYPMPVALTATGGMVSSGGNCAGGPTANLTAAAGSSPLSFQANTTGPASVQATFIDLLPGSLALNVVDTIAPSTQIVSGPSGTVTNTTASFDFSASEPATYECRLDNALFAACSDPVAFSNLSQGLHTLKVQAVDLSGNVDPAGPTQSWIIGPPDAGPPDAGPTADGGLADGGSSDGGQADAGSSDAGPLDAGQPDAGSKSDGGAADAGPATDAGSTRQPQYTVGCGCASTGPAGLWVLVAIAALRQRRGRMSADGRPPATA